MLCLVEQINSHSFHSGPVGFRQATGKTTITNIFGKKLPSFWWNGNSGFVIIGHTARFISNSTMDKIGNNIGYLVLKPDGAILQSSGDLENDEHSANVIMGIINLTESVDEKFIPNNGCERISIAYDDHVYNICMSNRLIYVVKLRTRETELNGTTKAHYAGAGLENAKGPLNVIT